MIERRRSGTRDQLLLEAGGLYARLYIEQFGSGQIEARFTDGVRFSDGSLMCERKDDERRADVSF